MWRILLTMAIVGFPLAVPAPQMNDGNPDFPLVSQNEPNSKEYCDCVPYYLCRNGVIVEDGAGLIDVKGAFDDDTLQTSPATPTYRVCTKALEVCCKPPKKPSIPRKGCGKKHFHDFDVKINTEEARFGEFPWMVIVLREEPTGENNEKMSVYQCGGALIHKQAVLTAAHCVKRKKPSELKIRAGEWDTQAKNEALPHQDRNVQHVIVHEKFSVGSLQNDFAILILSEPVNLTENVDIVCLPERNTVFDHSRCLASGWGRDIFGNGGRYQVILKKVDVPTVPHDQCQDRLRTTRLGKYFQLHESFICAGGEADKDTCTGDGGSPLVCPSKNDPTTYMQAGIVAWGIGCGTDGIPGVYANVAFARDWIDEQMVFYNLDNTVYQPSTYTDL